MPIRIKSTVAILLVFLAGILNALSPEMDKILSPSEKEWLEKHRTMRVGVDTSSYFRGQIDENGRYVGMGADYIRILEKKTGIMFKPELIGTWTQTIEKAKAKDIDILPIVARTPERDAYLNFSDTIVEMPNVIITRKDDKRIGNIGDLSGKTVTINKDYVVHEWVEDNYPKIILRPLSDTEQGLKAVASGEVDAYIGDMATAVYAINHLYISNLKIASDIPFSIKWGFAVRKDWPELIPILNKAISTITASEKDEILNRWATFSTGFGIRTILMIAIPLIVIAVIITLLFSNIRLKKAMNERKIIEEQLRFDEARLERLLKLSHFKAGSVQELLDLALEEAIALTSSKIGYVYHYSEEKKEFILNTWSKDVMKECTIANPQTVYKLEKTGIWGEVVRQRKPILINDFSAPDPLKKGYPAGHAPLKRFLSIPVFMDDRIVAVAGVANKEKEYDQSDLRQLTLLMDSVWHYVIRKNSEAEMEKLISDLQKALADVKTLSGLLPICASCKKIRDDKGYWANLESYLMAHSSTKFSHGICPDCARRLYPELSVHIEKVPPAGQMPDPEEGPKKL